MCIQELVLQVKSFLSAFLVVPLVFIIGLYLSISLKWIQVRSFRKAWSSMLAKNTSSKSQFSSFAALAAVLGGNLGTGNIAGVAVALSVGGPGSLAWMWVMAILGSVVKFTGTYLGVIYRRKNVNTNFYVGGPMYYLTYGDKNRSLAKVYAVVLICTAFLVGNLVQINSLSLPLSALPVDLHPLWIGIALAILVAWIILGKTKVFVRFVTMIVPLMAVIYLGACIYILVKNSHMLPSALTLIYKSAFSMSAFVSGGVAYGIGEAMKAGFDRGLFATDAGLGLAAILHAEVPIAEGGLEKGAIQQGMVSIIAPIVVMCICTVTGLVLISTGVWDDPCLESTNICIKAFNLGIHDFFGNVVITTTLILFAITTILTWLYCAQRAIEFLVDGRHSKTWVTIMQWVFILFIPLGTIVSVKMTWIAADVFLNLLLLINLYAILKVFPRHRRKIVEQVYTKGI